MSMRWGQSGGIQAVRHFQTTASPCWPYIFSGLTASIGGIVLASMTQQAMASTGGGYET